LSARRRRPRRHARARLWLVSAASLAFVAYLLTDADGLHLPRATLPTVLELRRVELVGLERLDARTLVREHTALRPGLPLLDVDPGAACASLLEHPRLRSCAAARVPPGRLVISLEEREPIALDERSGAGVDGEGTRFPLLADEAESLPRVAGALEPALAVLEEARARGIGIARIEVRSAEDQVVHLAEGGPRLRVGLDPQRSLEDWLRLARSELLAREGANEVDLRFRGSAVLRDYEHVEGGT
jgi:hypothetical protein